VVEGYSSSALEAVVTLKDTLGHLRHAPSTTVKPLKRVISDRKSGRSIKGGWSKKTFNIIRKYYFKKYKFNNIGFFSEHILLLVM
jgi:hypothetical protein